MTIPTGPRATEALLRRRAELPDGDPDRQRLRREAILAGLPMARQLAHRYAGRGEPLDDLIQVASLGLVQAVDGYDARRPESFAAYAVPTIRGMLRKHFRDHGWAMRVPRRLQERAVAVRDATDELTRRLGRAPRTSELAGYLCTGPVALAEAMRAAQVQWLPSLDRSGPAGDREALGAAEPGYDRVDDRLSLRQLLGTLPPREQRALALRYSRGLTYAGVAAELGISPAGAALLVGRSLEALRNADRPQRPATGTNGPGHRAARPDRRGPTGVSWN
jgi:RNA polymerase sigma-B factor